MRLIIGLFIVVVVTSCSRGYLEHADSYYDYSEAYDMCFKLKKGLLVVQVPSEGRKHQLMKIQFENEDNPKKKLKLKSVYENEIVELRKAQRSLVKGFPEYYKFSNVVFVPDTLVKDYKLGRRTNIFLDQELNLTSNISSDTASFTMYLRSFRDYDHLYIYTAENILPPKPFPYSSTVSSSNLNIMAKSENTILIENHQIYTAIVTLNRKLIKLYQNLPFGFNLEYKN